MAAVLAFALGKFTSTPAIVATPLVRGLHVPEVHHIPALAPVQAPFQKLAEPVFTRRIKDNSR
jgi:hypothetical protein